MRCEHAFDDGAYVLGALSPSERASFERHLAECATCREAVANIAVLPGLLGRLSSADAAAVASATAEFAIEQRLPKLVAAVGRARRKDRARLVVSVLVTAAVALFAGVTAGMARIPTDSAFHVPLPHSPSSPAMVPMVSVAKTYATAELAFEDTLAGTVITMHCAYPMLSEFHRPYLFRLFAIGSDGQTEQVSSWMAAPGEEVWLTGTVRLNMHDLMRVELRAKDNSVLLAYNVP
ncbi:MAG TPA: zf-HC2 domain-containing protein [Candidatus Limnocylindrales bacterium]|nr:zf-HC2 domain-containing protein [Candidatus Limnocylindrales bacterium]